MTAKRMTGSAFMRIERIVNTPSDVVAFEGLRFLRSKKEFYQISFIFQPLSSFPPFFSMLCNMR